MLKEVQVGALTAVEEMEEAAEEATAREEEVTAQEVAARAMVGKVVEEEKARVAEEAAVEVAWAFRRDR